MTRPFNATRTATRTATLAAAVALLGAGAARAAGELHIYNWTDYTSPELIEKFEQETGIEVTLDVYDTNETLLAKLKAGNAAYDIVVPSHNFVPILIQEGLLQPIDAAKLPGYENIDERWRNPNWDPGNVYTVPWQWGTTSYAVDTAVYKGPLDSYDPLFNPPPELAGKVGMFNSPDEVINMMLVAMGEPVCNEDPATMQRVLDALTAQKPAVKVYNADGIKERLVSGETPIAQVWNGYAMRATAEKPSIVYAFPSQGVITWMDSLAVPAGAKNRESALRFIEFMLRPENAGLQSNFARYANGITGAEAHMDPDLTANPALGIPEGVRPVFVPACSRKAIDLYSRVWTKLLQ